MKECPYCKSTSISLSSKGMSRKSKGVLINNLYGICYSCERMWTCKEEWRLVGAFDIKEYEPEADLYD